MVPLAGIIDVDAERARLGKELDKLRKETQRVEGKLGNAAFVAKAPPAVVEKERGKKRSLARQLEVLEAQLDRLAAL